MCRRRLLLNMRQKAVRIKLPLPLREVFIVVGVPVLEDEGAHVVPVIVTSIRRRLLAQSAGCPPRQN
jgi:hypothetical protein